MGNLKSKWSCSWDDEFLGGFDNMTVQDAWNLRAVLNEVSRHLNAAIKFDQLKSELLHNGWTEIITKQDSNTCVQWVEENCRGKYEHHKDSWVFEQSEDAAMFALRFSDT